MLFKSRANLLVKYLDLLKEDYSPLTIVETGTIRNVAPQYQSGDGHSTHIIADWVKNNGGEFYSIDLSVTVATEYMRQLGLFDHVTFVEDSSIVGIKYLIKNGVKPNLLYLDSANDAALTLKEFQTYENDLADGAIVIVDDCVPGSKELLKGNLIIPYARKQGYRVELTERQGIIYT